MTVEPSFLGSSLFDQYDPAWLWNYFDGGVLNILLVANLGERCLFG